MQGRWLLASAVFVAPLAFARAQSSCSGPHASLAPWPAPLDRHIEVAAGRLRLQDAIDRAGLLSGVFFTYSAEWMSADTYVCTSGTPVRLGDALAQWLEGTRLKPVVVGDNRVVLVPTRPAVVRPLSERLEMSTAELTPVVVVEESRAPLSESITVSRSLVTGEQLEATGASSLAQALSGAVPGLWMWAPSPTSVGGGMASLRGASSFGANYPKVYIDGVEVANPLFLSQLATDQVAFVEVIRGPQGAGLYGAGAVSGVVQITTRAAAGVSDGRRVSLRSTAGIAESAFSPLGAFVQDHALSARMGDALRSAVFGISTSTIGAFIPGAFSQQLQTSTGAGLVGERSRVQLSARLFAQRAGNAVSPLLPAFQPAMRPASAGARDWASGAPDHSPGLSPADSGAVQGVKEYTVGATWGLNLKRWAHTVVTGVDGYRLENVALLPGALRTPGDSALFAASGGADRGSVRWTSAAQFLPLPSVVARVTLGGDHSTLRDASLGSPTGGPVGGGNGAPLWRHSSGVNASAELSLWRALTVNGGLRMERNAGFTVLSGAAALPSFGAALRRSMGSTVVTLRSAYGKAISPPRVATRTAAWGGRVATVLALEPEEQSGMEVGADVILGSRFTASVTHYNQRADNLVQPVTAPASTGPGSRYQLQNVGAINNRGWEFEGSAGFGALSLTGGLGLTDSRVRRVANGYAGDLRAGDRVLQIPARTVSLSATWLGKRWTGSGTLARASDWMNYDWISRSADLADPGMTEPQGVALRQYWRRYEGVTRLRAAFTRDLTAALGLVFSGENLLGHQRGEPDNVTIVPGRTMRAGLRARF